MSVSIHLNCMTGRCSEQVFLVCSGVVLNYPPGRYYQAVPLQTQQISSSIIFAPLADFPTFMKHWDSQEHHDILCPLAPYGREESRKHLLSFMPMEVLSLTDVPAELTGLWGSHAGDPCLEQLQQLKGVHGVIPLEDIWATAEPCPPLA